jgi:hypothetical protein
MGKFQENGGALEFEPWWVASHWTVVSLDYKPIRDVLMSSPCFWHSAYTGFPVVFPAGK